MSALDTAKEIGRMAATATLSKDVIDLFEKKVALLTEQVASLESENMNLKKKVENLEQELERLRPKGDRLADGAEKILKFLFDREGEDFSPERLAQEFGMKLGVAQHYCDVLFNAEMVSLGQYLSSYYIVTDGRAYVVKYLLND
jgi:predicted nuclease with TOPRIM domain